MYETIRGWITRDGLTNRTEVVGRDDWTVDVDGPMLSDEVDEQAWLADRLRTKPQGEMSAYAAGPVWKLADYAEMAESKVPAAADGGHTISEEAARTQLREAMSYMSAPITVAFRPDPWDLRGDRVVVSEPDYDPTDDMVFEELFPVEDVTLVARELGTVPVLLAMSDTNLESAVALIVESDAQIARMLETEDRRIGMTIQTAAEHHLGALDFTAGNSGNAVQAAGRKPAVTDVNEDDDDPPEEKPLVYKKAEPPTKFHRDEWGFPIPPPADDHVGSEPLPPTEEPESEEEPVASPSPDQLGTGESADTASPDSGSSPSHYKCVEPDMRVATIQERGMRTRVQLTGYLAGKYVRGEADNFVIPDIMASAVREALQEIADLAQSKAPAGKGGPRVRIQLTEYAGSGGEYLRQDGQVSVAQNLSVPGMTVVDVAVLVDHCLALHFGVRRGDAAVLVRAWTAFAGPNIVAAVDAEEVAPVGSTGKPLVLPDLVGRTYSRRLHLGLCAVVEGTSLMVVGLWEREADAVLAARRVGARVVDTEGYLVPEEVEEAPLIDSDYEVRP